MELRHLRYFSAVAEQLSFRKAAQTLQTSHPSLCQQIKDLESELGTRLFERKRNKIALTEPGRAFLAGARQTLKSAVDAVEVTRRASLGYLGQLRIGVIGLSCPEILRQMISAFRQRFRNVQITLVQQKNNEGIDSLLSRTHVALGFLSRDFTKNAVTKWKSETLATASIEIASSFFDLSRNGVTLTDVQSQTFLIPDRSYAPDYFEWSSPVFTSLQSALPRMNAVESAESLFTMLRAGAGVALLSPLHIQNRSEGLSLTRLFEPEVEFTLSIVWDDRSEDLLLHNFLALSRELNGSTELRPFDVPEACSWQAARSDQAPLFPSARRMP
jgi:DNA-binding transcriptional LysR family regulator